MMDGKRVVITGGNSGIGFEAALALSGMGAEVVLACRNEEKAQEACREIERKTGRQSASYGLLDLSSLDSVRRFAAEFNDRYDRLDVLVNNAGWTGPRMETVDGYERTFATNHLAHFLLTHLLLDKIVAADAGRIIDVASLGYRIGWIDLDDLQYTKDYEPLQAYCNSKLANVYFVLELAERMKPHGVTVNTMHPGVVATNIWPSATLLQRIVWSVRKLFMISAKKGAETIIHLAASDEVEGVTGRYFFEKRDEELEEAARDGALQEELWKRSEALVGITSKH